MAGLVEPIADAIRRHGGRVLLKREATRIVFGRTASGIERPVAVETRRGETYLADIVIVNLPPSNVSHLVASDAPRHIARLPARPPDAWGAFVAYVGLDASSMPADLPIHRQVVWARPLGEGNSVFISLSLPDDDARAPRGHRAATLSTHTRLEPWWMLRQSDGAAYEARESEYVDRLLGAAESVMPGFRSAARLVLPGSPVAFARFTRRTDGWVGGYPQTSLLRNSGPRLGPGLWLVGDSIFPGQSTPAVALGALRVADQILRVEVGNVASLTT
jgi:phytoene dehydrogenase-like protein